MLEWRRREHEECLRDRDSQIKSTVDLSNYACLFVVFAKYEIQTEDQMDYAVFYMHIILEIISNTQQTHGKVVDRFRMRVS